MGHRREFLSGDWLGNAAFAGECLVRLVKSGCVFGGAIAWAIVMWWRRETWDRFLLILLVVWVVASPWYRPYPRLYLPLAFVLIVVAARAIGLVVDQARGRARWVVFLVLGVCMVRPCWQVATMRVDGAGYRSAVDAMRSAGLLRRPVVLACQDTMRFYVLSQPGASRQVAPIWAPGFDYDDEAWRGRVACVVDGAYEDDAELQAWLASRRAQARARVPNPLGWVVTANYRSSLNADGVIRVFDVPPAN